MKIYYGYCLRGDLSGALRAVKRAKSSTSKIKNFKQKVARRFVAQTETLEPKCNDPLVRSIIAEYRRYYRSALLSPKHLKDAEQVLWKQIRVLAQQYCKIEKLPALQDAFEKTLKDEFEKRGYYSIWGEVTPLRSLLVWKKQRSLVLCRKKELNDF